MPGLTSAQAARYRERGFLLLPDALSPSDFAPLIAELEAEVAAQARAQHAEGLLPEVFAAAPFERRLALLHDASRDPEALWKALHGKHLKTEGLFRIFAHPRLLDVVESLIGPEILAHPQFNLRAKLPGHDATVVPWHQDLGYLERDAEETAMVNLWIPLVDAPMETGAMQVIPGSHRWGLLPHERLAGYLGIPEGRLPPHHAVDCPVPLGGLLMIQHRTVHRSVPNRSDRVRWSLDLRYSPPGQPTGRPAVPGFLARSSTHPDQVARGLEDWLSALEGGAGVPS